MSTFELLRTKNSQIAPALPTRAHTYTLAHAHAPTTTINHNHNRDHNQHILR